MWMISYDLGSLPIMLPPMQVLPLHSILGEVDCPLSTTCILNFLPSSVEGFYKCMSKLQKHVSSASEPHLTFILPAIACVEEARRPTLVQTESTLTPGWEIPQPSPTRVSSICPDVYLVGGLVCIKCLLCTRECFLAEL